QLEIGEWPFLVEHADRRLAETLDSPSLGACSHAGDEDVVAMGRVVDDRHRRWALLALKGEDAGAVLAHEGASLLSVHHDHPPSFFHALFQPTALSAPRRQ